MAEPLLSAPVSGFSAHVIDRLLAGPAAVALLRQLAPGQLRQLEETKAAVRLAAAEWEAWTVSASADGNAETASAVMGAGLAHDIDIVQAAVVLGVTPRRVRQLAEAHHLGRKAGRVWLLDRTAVLALLAERHAA